MTHCKCHASLAIMTPTFVVFSLLICAGAKAFHTLPIHVHHFIPDDESYIHSSVLNTLLRQGENRGHNFPQGGNIWPVAIYWTYIDVGTPPVKFPVNVDSGSSNLDIKGVNCSGCSKKFNAYDPTISSTSKVGSPSTFSNSYLTCDLANMTARCTVSGNVYEDEVSLGSLGPVRVTFGSINNMTSNADQWKLVTGVMGFIGTGQRNVFSQLVKGDVVDNIFAVCFNNKGVKSNGTLTVGGVDPRLYTGEMHYVARKGSFFGMDVLRFAIGNKSGEKVVRGLPKQVILDTGTNILLLPEEGYASMKQQFVSMCTDGVHLVGVCNVPPGNKTLFEGGCFDLTLDDIAKYPSFNIGLDNGASLQMHAPDYLMKGDVRAKGNESLYCLAIRSTGPRGYFIFGDTLMRNYYLVFDVGQERLGWGTVNHNNCGAIPYN
jgi:hypothetical protein